jgi:16S rRNA (guanine527-N7)-methyltransferase
MKSEQFEAMLAEKGMNLSPRQLEQFETYYQTMVELNEKINLKAITEKE